MFIRNSRTTAADLPGNHLTGLLVCPSSLQDVAAIPFLESSLKSFWTPPPPDLPPTLALFIDQLSVRDDSALISGVYWLYILTVTSALSQSRDRDPDMAFCKTNFFKAQMCLVGEHCLFDSLVPPRSALASHCKAKGSIQLVQAGQSLLASLVAASFSLLITSQGVIMLQSWEAFGLQVACWPGLSYVPSNASHWMQWCEINKVGSHFPPLYSLFG